MPSKRCLNLEDHMNHKIAGIYYIIVIPSGYMIEPCCILLTITTYACSHIILPDREITTPSQMDHKPLKCHVDVELSWTGPLFYPRAPGINQFIQPSKGHVALEEPPSSAVELPYKLLEPRQGEIPQTNKTQ